MNKTYTIYRAYHKDSNRSYIGFDSSWPKRKYAHKQKTKSKNKQHFHNAIVKYGWENFEWEVLYSSSSREDCLEKEKFYIEEYNSMNNGFNMTLGGEGIVGWKHDEKTKLKIGQSNTGKIMSDDSRRLMSEKKVGKSSPNKGKTFSEEHRKKLSLSKQGKSRDDETKRKISSKLKGRVSPNKGNRYKLQKFYEEDDARKAE